MRVIHADPDPRTPWRRVTRELVWPDVAAIEYRDEPSDEWYARFDDAMASLHSLLVEHPVRLVVIGPVDVVDEHRAEDGA